LTYASLVALAIATTSCARPKSDNITAFATATSALASFAKSAADLDIEIDGKRSAAAAANAYSAGASKFPPNKGVFITGKSDADWKAISGFLDAVSAYASALAKANDPSLVSGLADKVSSVETALSKVASAKANVTPANAQRVTLIGGIVTDLVGVASNLYASIQITAAMDEAQTILNDARIPLRDSILAVVADSNSKLEDYRTALRCKLLIAKGTYNEDDCPKLTANDIKIPTTQATSIEQYDSYIAASQDYFALQARVEALKGLDKAIDAMVSGHQKLKDNLDNTAALTQFLQTVGDIADKMAKVEALRKPAKQ
jgi:hypothetical protein